MKKSLVSRLALAGSVMLLVAGLGTPVATAQAPGLQGIWQGITNDPAGTPTGTVIRLVVNKSEVKGVFTQVSPESRQIGFKPGDTSFVATASGSYLHGELTIHYPPPCHPNGRKVPMMGRMTPDGRNLALHHYIVGVDQNCRDTGAYGVDQMLFHRAAGG